jgi:DNA polymerase elongation subunit (family B)
MTQPPGAAGVPLTVLDIETDTDGVNGLDPTASRVVSAALAFSDGAPLVFEDADERVLLAGLDEVVRSRTGLLVTWNGAGFDLPFIAVRSERLGLPTGLVTVTDPGLPVKYAPPAGLGLPVRARWGGTAHVDIAFLYQRFAEVRSIPWSLKPVARAAGLEPVEVDRERIHDLDQQALRAYVLSDVVTTLALAERLRLTDLLKAVLPLEG